MKRADWLKTALIIGVAGGSMGLVGCGGERPIVPPPPVPAEYADKHMPEGWWTDEKIIEEGRQIFLGKQNIDVNCASCHGRNGKPVKAGARDFRRTEQMRLYSDSVWFWRISEGVPNTKMKAWKSKLSEEDRWKVMAFERTFGLDGKKYDPVAKAWIPNEQTFAKASDVAGKEQAGSGQASDKEQAGSGHASDEASADQTTGTAPAGQGAKTGTN